MGLRSSDVEGVVDTFRRPAWLPYSGGNLEIKVYTQMKVSLLCGMTVPAAASCLERASLSGSVAFLRLLCVICRRVPPSISPVHLHLLFCASPGVNDVKFLSVDASMT